MRRLRVAYVLSSFPVPSETFALSDILALRQGDWKYIPANAKGMTTGTGGADASDARFAPARLVEPQLFNLATDPDEKTNIIKEHPAKAAGLQQRLNDIQAP